MERWQRARAQAGCAPPDEVPQVLSAEGPHGPVVHAANRAARLTGVRTGARVVDMRALVPALQVEPADPAGDAAAMDRLALWARRWCPWTAVDGLEGDEGLILDTTGSDHLWGGEAAMLEEMEARLSSLGISAGLAVAPTWGAAWALARFGPVRAICHDASDLSRLPMAGLRLEPETLLLLHRLGLRTVGDLAAVPRLSLARRFARAPLPENPLMRLDQATGRLAEPLSPPDADPVFRAEVRLAEPILEATHHLPGLCDDLCDRLAAAHRGARRLTLAVYRTDGEVRSVEAAVALASREPVHLCRLFAERLERIDAGFGFDLVTLEARVTEPLAPAQARIGGGDEAALDLAQLVDRLGARFGARAVSGLALRESHIPERAEMRTAPGALRGAPPVVPVPARPVLVATARVPGAVAAAPGVVGTPPALRAAPAAPPPARIRPVADRPLRLLDPPEEVRVLYAVPEGPPAQFVWRRTVHAVIRYQGPERIAPEWWQDRPGTRLRDYFKVEDGSGRRFWLYREGLYEDGRGGDPRWFLHGMFA